MTARDELQHKLITLDWHNEKEVDVVLNNLPLVLEAAREAGKVKQGTKPIPDFGTATVPNLGSVSSGWWFLIPSGAEPTPERHLPDDSPYPAPDRTDPKAFHRFGETEGT